MATPFVVLITLVRFGVKPSGQLQGLARTWLQSAANYSKEKVITDQFGDFVRAWRDLGIDIDEFEVGTRPAVKHDGRTVHHRDGSTSTKFSVGSVEQVPARMIYQAWMIRQLGGRPGLCA